jgi:acyl-coenzyme A synthetase/AMP-(fatty) acid ligase
VVENAAMSHPGVLPAAVIGIAHPTRQEHPLLVAVPSWDGVKMRRKLLGRLGLSFLIDEARRAY